LVPQRLAPALAVVDLRLLLLLFLLVVGIVALFLGLIAFFAALGVIGALIALFAFVVVGLLVVCLFFLRFLFLGLLGLDVLARQGHRGLVDRVLAIFIAGEVEGPAVGAPGDIALAGVAARQP